jgi:hypothetical protein
MSIRGMDSPFSILTVQAGSEDGFGPFPNQDGLGSLTYKCLFWITLMLRGLDCCGEGALTDMAEATEVILLMD